MYKACAKRNQHGRKIWAVKGVEGTERPLVRMMKKDSGGDGSPKFLLGVDIGKEAIMHATTLETPGPRYMHFPVDYDRGYDEEYFRGLCSEKIVEHKRAGRSTIRWEKFYERNEPLDMRNYALIAYRYFRWNFDKLERLLGGKDEKVITKAQAAKKKYNPVISRGIQI